MIANPRGRPLNAPGRAKYTMNGLAATVLAACQAARAGELAPQVIAPAPLPLGPIHITLGVSAMTDPREAA